ncbi:MAG: S41 family peptidase [Solirubrobacteraceae bacterium]|nr:S41 family peptidase [Solirubrobacteraceae bacterium]
MKTHTLRNLLLVLALGAAAFGLVVFGIWIGGRHADLLPSGMRSSLVGSNEQVFVQEAIDRVGEDYYRKLPPGRLADLAIGGLVDGLNDRFSAYFTPAEYRRFLESQNSEFSGIGVNIVPARNGLKIVNVYKDAPARDAGLRNGDVIVAAGSRPLKGLSTEKAASLIKGPKGTTVVLTVDSGGKERRVRVRREEIKVPVVESKLVKRCGKKVGVVALSQFSSGAHAEVYEAIRRLRRKGATAWAFDLRGNGGGLVDEAQLVASAFLSDGPVVTTRGRNVPERTLNATGQTVVPKGDPVIVLVNRGSASAAEIVAGALQDRGRAKLLGERTFGKGVFQQVIELTNGGALDITSGQYFTPKGRNLGGQGVKRGSGLKPDVVVAIPRGSRRDVQLDAATARLADCVKR